MAMVADTIPRFDDHEINPDRMRRQRDAARQAVGKEPSDRRSQMRSLAVIERLLRQPEVAAGTPANLDDHELRWRAAVDRHDVQLAPTDPNVPAKDRPARPDEAIGHEVLRGIAGPLGGGPLGGGPERPPELVAHRWNLAGRAHRGLNGHLAALPVRASMGAVPKISDATRSPEASIE